MFLLHKDSTNLDVAHSLPSFKSKYFPNFTFCTIFCLLVSSRLHWMIFSHCYLKFNQSLVANSLFPPLNYPFSDKYDVMVWWWCMMMMIPKQYVSFWEIKLTTFQAHKLPFKRVDGGWCACYMLLLYIKPSLIPGFPFGILRQYKFENYSY